MKINIHKREEHHPKMGDFSPGDIIQNGTLTLIVLSDGKNTMRHHRPWVKEKAQDLVVTMCLNDFSLRCFNPDFEGKEFGRSKIDHIGTVSLDKEE